jgi:hypothetical protein
MAMLVLAAVFAAVALGAAARALRPPRACHYCGRLRAPRHLQAVELSDAGPVAVCRDVEPCRREAARSLAR